MSIPLTFTGDKILETALVGPDNAVHYTTSTTSGVLGRKITTVSGASGANGVINWRDKTFTINGEERNWKDLRSRTGGVFSSEHEWNWGPRPFRLKYHNSQKELLATPSTGNPADTVRFTVHRPRLLHENEPAVIYFPPQMQDESERMFLLMAILQTDTIRQDNVGSVFRVRGAALNCCVG
ncbi:hypothetical protein R3P38DRAFT_2721409 [Favolaschia claudopus]|uniref:DUF6593 domain-containing protein n=1 Tax=Favolaschia claudopus TaxID=2862362 RepID=A0AAW0AIM6_9AGAR